MANKILKSKKLWILTLVVFVLLVVFFDRNSFMDRAEIKEEIEVLKTQRDYYLERIREDSTEIEKLKDNDYLEQYAREHFLMKRDSDVVYVLENPVVPTSQIGR